MAERRSLKSSVTGSSPVWGANFKYLVSSPEERQSLKLCAVGSTPIRGTIFGCDIRSACSLGSSPSTTANFRPSSSVGQKAGQDRVFPSHMQPAGRRVRRGKGMPVRILTRPSRKLGFREHRLNKPGVLGSSPSLGTIWLSSLTARTPAP